MQSTRILNLGVILQLSILIVELFFGLILMIADDGIRSLNQIFVQIVAIVILVRMIYAQRKDNIGRVNVLITLLISLFSFAMFVFVWYIEVNLGIPNLTIVKATFALITGVGMATLLIYARSKNKDL